MLGNLEDPNKLKMEEIEKNLKNIMKKKKSHDKKSKNTLQEYKAVNSKLQDGFKISLNVIVDLSNILKSHHYFLDEIQDLLSNMDKDYNEKSKTITEIKSLTDDALNTLSLTYHDQLNEMLETYEKNNMDTKDLKKLTKILK